MAREDFVLAPCLPEDIDQMIDVYLNAFKDDYFGSFTFPRSNIPEDEMYQWLRNRFLKTLRTPEYRCFKVTEVSTGRIGAWVRWQYPHTLSEEQKAEKKREKEREEREKAEGKLQKWPRGANLEVCDIKFGWLDRMREKNVDVENMYVILLLMTDPAYQRKGLANMLLKHGLALADAEGRKAYIEATPAGHPVYKKLGFQDIDVLSVDLSKWGGTKPGTNTIMLRDPQPV